MHSYRALQGRALRHGTAREWRHAVIGCSASHDVAVLWLHHCCRDVGACIGFVDNRSFDHDQSNVLLQHIEVFPRRHTHIDLPWSRVSNHIFINTVHTHKVDLMSSALALVLVALVAPSAYIILSFLSLLQFQALYLAFSNLVAARYRIDMWRRTIQPGARLGVLNHTAFPCHNTVLKNLLVKMEASLGCVVCSAQWTDAP